jgi:hypothetical protein
MDKGIRLSYIFTASGTSYDSSRDDPSKPLVESIRLPGEQRVISRMDQREHS